jgi:hypothetical protein
MNMLKQTATTEALTEKLIETAHGFFDEGATNPEIRAALSNLILDGVKRGIIEENFFMSVLIAADKQGIRMPFDAAYMTGAAEAAAIQRAADELQSGIKSARRD